MATAAFQSEPQASAAAIILRELGFKADVYVRDGSDFEERAREFFAGNTPVFEPKAILVSSDVDRDRFVRTVQRHYGVVVRDGL